MSTRVVVIPDVPALADAVTEAGGVLVDDASNADAIVWANPFDTQGLKDALARSDARWVQLPFAGIESFIEAGIVDDARIWTCTKGIYGPATAEQALALILSSARLIHAHARAHGWKPSDALGPHQRLAGSTAVIVGTGGIGGALARMLEPLDVTVLGVNRSGKPVEGFARVGSLRELLPEADWVVLACALTKETEHVIDDDAFALMKSSAWLVNVARGRVVDTDALVRALDANSIAGAALDVTDPEPLPDDHPLWARDNVVITSHTANTVAMAIPELRAMVKRNVQRFARGEELEGLVDPRAGY